MIPFLLVAFLLSKSWAGLHPIIGPTVFARATFETSSEHLLLRFAEPEIKKTRIASFLLRVKAA